MTIDDPGWGGFIDEGGTGAPDQPTAEQPAAGPPRIEQRPAEQPSTGWQPPPTGPPSVGPSQRRRVRKIALIAAAVLVVGGGAGAAVALSSRTSNPTTTTQPLPTTPPSSSSTSTTGGTGVTGAQAGNGTPEEAVAGVLIAVLVDNHPSSACPFVLPTQQQRCEATTPTTTGTATVTGRVDITGQAVEGTRAVVSGTGRLCTASSTGSPVCVSNSNPSFGLPGQGVSFSTAYANAVAAGHSSSPKWSGFPCEEVHGKWYVNLLG